MNPELYSTASLWKILERLRGEGGCPWDKKQTPESMVKYFLDEGYELADAVLENRADAVCEELGDVLFQLLFIIFLYQEKGLFSFSDVTHRIEAKLIRRHPHVFGSEKLDTVSDVARRWEEIKSEEKAGDEKKSLLSGIPRSQPALSLAMAVSRKVAACGFDWDEESAVWEKVNEEMAEFKDAVHKNSRQETAMEFGDLLFSLVNVARFRKIDPEEALREMVAKFSRRFQHMEAVLAEAGKEPASVGQEALEFLWQDAKRME
ncbi:tetrapyrrole methylase family protein/MazG family protein [Desulfobotulus alkaliphilus]|uniref:Nucleoside triphosphate pyrophosphohydrolase n=2 Tax=Desulfobotulus alkaliphilus TaxID=622671 RepID=A0A562RSZ6_9BACT|nr:tetrapyrrole methylase family protein/MazG family protein [Desulfobotulus alkaliphilus]